MKVLLLFLTALVCCFCFDSRLTISSPLAVPNTPSGNGASYVDTDPSGVFYFFGSQISSQTYLYVTLTTSASPAWAFTINCTRPMQAYDLKVFPNEGVITFSALLAGSCSYQNGASRSTLNVTSTYLFAVNSTTGGYLYSLNTSATYYGYIESASGLGIFTGGYYDTIIYSARFPTNFTLNGLTYLTNAQTPFFFTTAFNVSTGSISWVLISNGSDPASSSIQLQGTTSSSTDVFVLLSVSGGSSTPFYNSLSNSNVAYPLQQGLLMMRVSALNGSIVYYTNISSGGQVYGLEYNQATSTLFLGFQASDSANRFLSLSYNIVSGRFYVASIIVATSSITARYIKSVTAGSVLQIKQWGSTTAILADSVSAPVVDGTILFIQPAPIFYYTVGLNQNGSILGSTFIATDGGPSFLVVSRKDGSLLQSITPTVTNYLNFNGEYNITTQSTQVVNYSSCYCLNGLCRRDLTCACDFGFGTSDCSGSCPVSSINSLPCGGVNYGVCSPFDATCVCLPAQTGTDCSTTRPATTSGSITGSSSSLSNWIQHLFI